MSLGATQKEERFHIAPMKKAGYVVKKTITAFFEDALGKIFDIFFLATMIGLFFGKIFPWQYYAMMTILALIQIYKFFSPEKVLINEIREKK